MPVAIMRSCPAIETWLASCLSVRISAAPWPASIKRIRLNSTRWRGLLRILPLEAAGPRLVIIMQRGAKMAIIALHSSWPRIF
jgi:hypothetical protein